mgnify:CR=1 FL=1
MYVSETLWILSDNIKCSTFYDSIIYYNDIIISFCKQWILCIAFFVNIQCFIFSFTIQDFPVNELLHASLLINLLVLYLIMYTCGIQICVAVYPYFGLDHRGNETKLGETNKRGRMHFSKRWGCSSPVGLLTARVSSAETLLAVEFQEAGLHCYTSGNNSFLSEREGEETDIWRNWIEEDRTSHGDRRCGVGVCRCDCIFL